MILIRSRAERRRTGVFGRLDPGDDFGLLHGAWGEFFDDDDRTRIILYHGFQNVFNGRARRSLDRRFAPCSEIESTPHDDRPRSSESGEEADLLGINPFR